MKVRFTPEAEQQAGSSDAWWREHREARDLFARELAAMLAVLSVDPKLGKTYTILHGQPVRREAWRGRTDRSESHHRGRARAEKTHHLPQACHGMPSMKTVSTDGSKQFRVGAVVGGSLRDPLVCLLHGNFPFAA